MAALDTNTKKLVLVPALISLAVTLLRVAGELGHWSENWFSTATRGFDPRGGGMAWLFGITWLAAPFGIYFAWRLAGAGKGAISILRHAAMAAAGLLILLEFRVATRWVPWDFPYF